MAYKKFLQIDDDSDDCELFMDALNAVSTSSYTGINDPVEAFEKLVKQEIKPDVIFLDLNMPVMSGLELLAEIKKQETLQQIPIIIFSTSQLEDFQSEAKQLGAYEYISKPNNFNELKRILSKYASEVKYV